LLASLTEAELESLSRNRRADTKRFDAEKRAIEHEARRIIRTRREAERKLLNDDERAARK